MAECKETELRMGILEALKSETMAIHQELEQVSLLKKIMTREITLQEYAKLLLIFYQFICPRETNIKSTFPTLLNGREKSSLLLADLSVLRVTCSNLYSCETASIMSTETEIYGYLYVMEGATLGGQVITQALTQNPQLPENVTTRYFNAYGKDTRRKWLDFTRILSERNVTSSQHEQVITSAVTTFTALLCLLQETIQNGIA